MAENYIPLARQGYTSTIYHLPGEPPRVCKSFDKSIEGYRSEKLFAAEKTAYERFAANDPPRSILKYYGQHESIPNGLVLEFAENHDLGEYLWQHAETSRPNELLYRWASQAAEALEFAHAVGVCNSDIHSVNFFLDGALNLKVGDWAGASIDGGKSQSSYRLKYRLFDEEGRDVPRRTGITATTEVFALGTVLFHMVSGEEPWPELRQSKDDDDEIKRKIGSREFPQTADLPVLGSVISRCWNVEFTSMTEVRRAIEAETESFRRSKTALLP